LAPEAVVVSGTVEGSFEGVLAPLREVALHAPLYLAGAAASEDGAQRAHGELLGEDVVEAAELLTRGRG
jgi:hypothetical protein